MPTIFDHKTREKSSYRIPTFNLPDGDTIPYRFLNKGLDLVEAGEVDVVRHYTKLSTKNFGVDTGMYPLGSCTMKYNPKINEKVASFEGFAGLHPMADTSLSQGVLRIMYDLSAFLGAITGMKRFSLIPAAGAHGELSSVMIIKKYFEKLKQNRKIILIPDTAHGTNPASVAMCGFEVKEVPSTADGDVDIEILK